MKLENYWVTSHQSSYERSGIPALLDVEDMLITRPEPLSTITYLSQFYHKFHKLVRHSVNLSKNNNAIDFQAWTEEANKENELAAKKAEENRIKNEEIRKGLLYKFKVHF